MVPPPWWCSVIMMALHGLWMMELLGISLGEENHTFFMEELFRLAETPSGDHDAKKEEVTPHA